MIPHGKVFKGVALSFDDVLIRPDYSEVTKDDLDVMPLPIGKMQPKIPIISSCMDTVTEMAMIESMRDLGGFGIYHRYTPSAMLETIVAKDPTIPIAIGTWKSYQNIITRLVHLGVRMLVIDVAHGHSKAALDTIKAIKDLDPEVVVISGNIATSAGAARVIRAGADGARVGIGGGSACTTRMVTGCGTPTLQSILDIRHDFPELLILADGGIRSGGDLAKAIGAGANYVIVGGMLAGTAESPGQIVQKVVNGENKRYKLYRGMACYSHDTEVLTLNGWKQIKDLNQHEHIAVLDPENDEMKFEMPKKLYSYDYTGKMYHAETQNVDLLVTPNHNLWVGKRNSNRLPEYDFIKAEDAYGEHWKHQKHCQWFGVEEEWFNIPETNMRVPMHEWMLFFGFWLAEGCVETYQYDRNGKTYTCHRISLSNNDHAKITRYEDILRGWGLRPLKRQRGDNFELQINHKQFAEFLLPLGKAHEKYVPQRFKHLSSRLLMYLLVGFSEGDGCESRNCLFTASTQLRDDLYELAIKTGHTPSITMNHKAGTKKRIGAVEFTTNHDLWCISLSDLFQRPFVKSEQVSWEDYDGKVYCVEVSSHIVLVRRNNKYVWCGNSYEAQVNGNGKDPNNVVVEGDCFEVPYVGPAALVVNQLVHGLKQAMHYVGAANLEEFYENCFFQPITVNGYMEGTAHRKAI